MRRSLIRGLGAALVVWLVALTHARAAWHAPVATEANRGVDIEISSPFEHSPPGGYMPLWVTIRNDSGAARTWMITCEGAGAFGINGGKQTTTGSLRVENGQTSRLPVLMALKADGAGSFYQTYIVRVEGYAATEIPTPVPGINANAKNSITHSLGMSEALATPIWTSLTKLFTDAGQDLMGTPVDLGLLDSDWRALAGLDYFWLTDADYLGLDAPRRAAIRDWVSHGGRLYLCAQAPDPSLRAGVGLPEGADQADEGLGTVQILPWDGKPLPLAAVQGKTDPAPSVRADTAFTQADWPMVESIGRIPLNAPFLIAFIVLFAVVIGPLNLFWLAGARRRHRLFWTTPVISVAASLLLAGFIVLQDGFGGNGERVMFCLLLPDQKKAVVCQEEAARTGVLFSRQFTMAEDVILTPLHIETSGGRRSYEQNGRSYSGDWFASRSLQAHRLEAIVPSRAEIQLLNADAARGGAAPVVTSSVPATLLEVRYCDAAGGRWRGENLRTGERISLSRYQVAGEPEAPAKLPPAPDKLPASPGSALLDAAAERFLNTPGCFVASAAEGPFFETLPAVRWRKQSAIFAGAISIAR